MSEQKFSSSVFKLNRNILHMCFLHNLELDALNPRNTLCNLLLLLSAADNRVYCPTINQPMTGDEGQSLVAEWLAGRGG